MHSLSNIFQVSTMFYGLCWLKILRRGTLLMGVLSLQSYQLVMGTNKDIIAQQSKRSDRNIK